MDVTTLQLPFQANCSRLGPEGANQLVAFGGRDGGVYVYPFGDFPRTAYLCGGHSPSTAVAFDPQQRRLAGGSDDGSVRLWDIETERMIRVFGEGHKSTVTATDFNHRTDFIATCSRDRSLRIWDVRKKTCRQSYKEAASPLCATQFSPSGRWVVSGCADGVVRLYDLVSGRGLHEFRSHAGPITSIHFHPERYYMAVGSNDGSVSLWELENFTKIFQSKCLDTPVDSVRLFGKKMLVAAYNILRVYDFSRMSDSTSTTIDSSWSIIGDLSYSSIVDEALYVEFSGMSASMGRIPLTEDYGRLAPPRVASPSPHKLGPRHVQTLRSKEQEEDSESRTLAERSTRRRESPVPTRTAVVRNNVDQSEAYMEELLSTSVTIVSVLQQRLAHLRTFRSLWTHDTQQALEYLKELHAGNSDYGVIADFLVVMQNLRMKERINLSNLSDLLDIVMFALTGERENQLLAALKVLKSMGCKFRAKMDEGRRLASSSHCPDKSNTQFNMKQYYELSAKFDAAASLVQKLESRKGPVAEEVREVLNEIPHS
ncbi:WD domain [Trypanosoma vivax]|uniref:Putative katanin n=1 Tax=Trypanosoma vivax (strain Y486) TaxID=1055687 RepID=G0U2W2_TRYVY|nr:putative katanin [Trypanosoma vivax]KAH8604206.1 WD domain [Trypanosoma vivax]CCC50616.1 putative katanin [Trypanosoma vivax Y486]